MAIVTLRRWEDNFLLSDFCLADTYSRKRWQATKPIHMTIAGNSIPQKTSVMEHWWEATFVFESDEDTRPIENYDILADDVHNDDALAPVYFKFRDVDGTTTKCRIMQMPEVTPQAGVLDATVIDVKCVFRAAGFVA